MTESFGIIGAGHLGTCLLTGLVQSGIDTAKIKIADPKKARLDKIRENTGVFGSTNNQDVVDGAEVVVLALRPGDVLKACSQLDFANKVVISAAAGIRLSQIKKATGSDQVIRAMPNLAAVVNASMTALFTDKQMSPAIKRACESLFRCVGETLWLNDEALMKPFTALCGSSPALLISVTQQLENIAQQYGFDHKTAQFMVRQTLYGTGKLMLSQETSSQALISSICVSGGVTEAMLSQWNSEQVASTLANAIQQGVNKHVDGET